MNFFIDFEATQYSERIISIGCICENGQTFSSLVRPAYKGWKITKFITDLTGITKEMIENAPPTEFVFSKLLTFIATNSNSEKPTFYCYGNCDVRYIQNAIKEITSFNAVSAASLILANLEDYAPTVAKYFNIEAVGLNRVYKSLLHDDHIQNHDALEDAKMLKYITENLETSNLSRADLALPGAKPKPGDIAVPDIFQNWNGKKLWDANTNADVNNYAYMCTCSSNIHCKYFDSLDTAAFWIIKYVMKGYKPHNVDHVTNVKRNLLKGIDKEGKTPYGMTWSSKEME